MSEPIKFKLVEKKDHLAVHGLFDSLGSATRHLTKTVPLYVARSYFADKTLTVDSFEIISYTPGKAKVTR